MNIQNENKTRYTLQLKLTFCPDVRLDLKLLKPDLELDTNFLQCQTKLALRSEKWLKITEHCILFFYYIQIFPFRTNISS